MVDAFNNVYPTLLGCFGIILIGYLFGRLNVITETQGKGLGLYISRLALPALLFKSLVELDFDVVNWNFWFAILIAKAALFIVVAFLSLVVTHPMSDNVGKAGLFAIFVTQSNDLALGLPLFDAIFKESHPEYSQYLYLLIPVSVALLNPIGFLMLEFHKSSKDKSIQISKRRIIWKAIKGVITNPLVFMVALGLIGNVVVTAINFDVKQKWFLKPFLDVVGNSFGACALFYLGLNLVGNMKKHTGAILVVPFLLVICKSLILPMLTREAVYWLDSGGSDEHNTTCLTSFAFIYGTLPTAPPVLLFATMYDTQVDVIGTSMVLGTLLSAPIMFVSSKMISVMKSVNDKIDKTFSNALFDIGILSSVCCIWVFLVFFTTKYHRRVLHQYTLVLIAFQLLTALSMAVSHADVGQGLLALFAIGLIGSTLWTALVSYALSNVRCKGERYASKKKVLYFLAGILIPVAIGTILALETFNPIHMAQIHNTTDINTASLTPIPQGSTSPFLSYLRHNKPFNYVYGISQVISVITCVVSLIVLQRCDKYCRCRSKYGEKGLPNGQTEEESAFSDHMCKRCKSLSLKAPNDIEDLPDERCHQSENAGNPTQCLYERCKEESANVNSIEYKQRSYGAISPISSVNEAVFDELKDIEELTLEEYLQGDDHQLSRHIVLILFQCLFSILNIFLCFGRINGSKDSHSGGVYIEIEFLALVCTVGQGFLSFATFGFNKLFFNALSFERYGILQPACVARKIKLPQIQNLDPKIKSICTRFKSHHLESCRNDIVTDLRFHFKSYKNVFRGDQLVDWIVEFGLANTRMDAVQYGNSLLRGRIIEHCVNEHLFYDLPYFYRFCNDSEGQIHSN